MNGDKKNIEIKSSYPLSETTTSNKVELYNIFECSNCGNILSIDIFKTKGKNNFVSFSCNYCNSPFSQMIPIKDLSSLLYNKILNNSPIIITNKCFKHKKPYNAYCEKCQKNLCEDCLNEENHKENIINYDKIKLKNEELYSLKVKLFNIENFIKEIENKANIFIENLDNLKNELKNNLIKFKIQSYKNLNFSKRLLDFYLINKENNLNYNIINNIKEKLKFNDLQQIPTNMRDFINFLKEIEIFNIEKNILSESDKKEFNLNENDNNIIYSRINNLNLILEKNVINDAYTENINNQIFDLYNKYDINNNLNDYIIYSNNTTNEIKIYDIKNFKTISKINVNFKINYLKVFTLNNNFYYYYIEKNKFYIRDLEHNLKVKLIIFSKSLINSLNYIYYENKILFVFNSYNSSNLKFYIFEERCKTDLNPIKMCKYINYVDFFIDNNNNYYLIISGLKILKCYLLNFILNNNNNDNNENNNIINIKEHKNYFNLIKTKMDVNFENNEFNKFVIANLSFSESLKTFTTSPSEIFTTASTITVSDEVSPFVTKENKIILIASNSNYIFFIDFIKDEIIKIVNISSKVNPTLCVWDKFLIYNDGREIMNINIIENDKLITNNIKIKNEDTITTLLKRKISFIGDCLLSHDKSGNIKIWSNED